jgi:hypothetical protein
VREIAIPQTADEGDIGPFVWRAQNNQQWPDPKKYNRRSLYLFTLDNRE